jgi:AraC family transcriptional regulator, regulatory protein of adaptative response / methylated-DNA-[protein]-cysteine methyltransferase
LGKITITKQESMLTTLPKVQPVFTMAQLETPLGSIIAVADESALYFLEFSDHRTFEKKLKRLQQKTQALFIDGRTGIIDTLEQELMLYFSGKLHQFKTPVRFVGTPFQQQVWHMLQKIPHGQTYSYAQLAQAMGQPKAYRAVAQANGANSMPIIIPCHRVINRSGALGGYSGGLRRKIWLLDHEKKIKLGKGWAHSVSLVHNF